LANSKARMFLAIFIHATILLANANHARLLSANIIYVFLSNLI